MIWYEVATGEAVKKRRSKRAMAKYDKHNKNICRRGTAAAVYMQSPTQTLNPTSLLSLASPSCLIAGPSTPLVLKNL